MDLQKFYMGECFEACDDMLAHPGKKLIFMGNELAVSRGMGREVRA